MVLPYFDFTFYSAVAVLGLIVGSFLNVVILRYGTGMTLRGRSKCFNCEKKLAWYELIPLFSFLAQRGACRGCKSSISWQYPTVEVLSAGIFVLVAWVASSSVADPVFDGWFALTILSISLVMAIYDMRHKVVPDGMVYSAAFIALVYAVSRNLMFAPLADSWIDFGLDIAAGPLMALPFWFLWKISGGRWIGLGDAKVALTIGWFLGLHGGVSAVIFAFWVGALFAIGALFWQKGLTRNSGGRDGLSMKTEVPFVPFLLIGMLIVYATGAAPADLIAPLMHPLN